MRLAVDAADRLLRRVREPAKVLPVADPLTPPSEAGAYPVRFDVDYPDRQLNRLTTAFRLIVAIPILIVAATLGGQSDYGARGGSAWMVAGGTGGVLSLAPLLMILFREKYPRWWFNWNLELLRFSNRIAAYLALLDDRYPSTDEHQSVRLDLPYPDVQRDLNRWLPLVKWLLAIPHYILLLFLWLAAIVAVVIGVVRDPLHRALPARPVRLRRRRHTVGQPRGRVRLRARDGRVSAVSAQRLTVPPSARGGNPRRSLQMLRLQLEDGGADGRALRHAGSAPHQTTDSRWRTDSARAAARPIESARNAGTFADSISAFKPVRRGSPTLGRFDSCAAPLSQNPCVVVRGHSAQAQSLPLPTARNRSAGCPPWRKLWHTLTPRKCLERRV
jgi:hypothetical protein